MDNAINLISNIISIVLEIGLTLFIVWIICVIVYAVMPYSIQKTIRDALGVNNRKKK